MANTDAYFKQFDSEVKLSESKKESLRKSRNKLREYIRNAIKEKDDIPTPLFRGQGSYSMGTSINPIARIETKNGESKKLFPYDIDDGVYFEGTEADRKSTSTYHNWIWDAVDGHTGTPPIDKNTCIRTVFSDGHHIDQPIYYKVVESGEFYLAHKRDGWVKSDPKAFVDWFKDQVKERPQLTRLVRYSKAWLDYLDQTGTATYMPSGFIFTILLVEEYSAHDRDDVAFKETLQKVHSRLSGNFSCHRPVGNITEELMSSHEGRKSDILARLKDLVERAKEALAESNEKKSTEIWQKVFGDRFPLGKDVEAKAHPITESLRGMIPSTTRPYAS